jgi:hypothetical protein
MDGRTERLTEARPYKHSSRPFAWIGQQVQTQAIHSSLISFWALAGLSFAAVPLALFLRNVKQINASPETKANFQPVPIRHSPH